MYNPEQSREEGMNIPAWVVQDVNGVLTRHLLEEGPSPPRDLQSDLARDLSPHNRDHVVTRLQTQAIHRRQQQSKELDTQRALAPQRLLKGLNAHGSRSSDALHFYLHVSGHT
jgi:hypothetical protein